jgi:hypothetical protein
VQARARWWRETAWDGLPTAVPSTAGVRGDGGGGTWVEHSELGSGTGGIERRGDGNAAAREREEVKARRWAVHGDEEVAAGEGSGSSWRARARLGREGTAAGKARGDTWAHVEAGCGARGPVPAVSGGGRAEQRGKRRWQR